MKEILDVLFDYSMKRKIFDIAAIEKIFKSYKKEFNIDILKKLNIIDKFEIIFGHPVVGTYVDDYIDIYYSRIMCTIRINDFKSDFMEEDILSILEGFYRRNLFILLNVCHEMEHAIQAQISKNTPRSLEQKLIKIENDFLDNMGKKVLDPSKYDLETDEFDLSSFEYIKYIHAYNKENRLYKSNYDISLLERLADLDAMTKLYNMCEEIKSYIPNLYILLDKLILERKLQGYDYSFISPTTEFFINLTGERQFYFPNYINMSLEERLRLGLPINTKEYDELYLKLKH